MLEDVQIIGGGIAACCCASLLSKAGFRVHADLAGRAGSPVLMLSEQTQLLLRDVFDKPELFAGAVEIERRVVAWGEGSKVVTLPHSGLVIPESTLLNRLWPMVNLEPLDYATPKSWRVIASKPALPSVSEHNFGERIASTHAVELSDHAYSDACWVESTASGWLFLLPCGDKKAALISVGGNADTLLAESRLISDQIAALSSETGNFPAYPRIAKSLGGPQWIACGTAAVAFDPIAGEGVGHAVREGILASAVIRAAVNGAGDEDLLGHYTNRVLSGFSRHLEECCQFYSATPGPWWQSELESMKRGIQWVHDELASGRPSRFRLVGFELLPV